MTAYATLGEICRPKQWKTLSKSEMSEVGYPVYGANGKIGFADDYTHEEPTILIGCRGSCGTVIVTESKSYANGNAMALDELDRSRVDIRYLFRYLSFRGFADVTTGSSQPQIIGQNLRRIEIPLPTLEEQRRTAAVLDNADTLRDRRRQGIATLSRLRHSLFIQMFGDPARNDRCWPLLTLGELGAIHTGKTPPTALEGMFGGNIPFVTPGDLGTDLSRTERTVTEAGSRYTKVVRAGSALVGCIGHIGKIARAPVPCSFNQQINAVEWDVGKVDDAFGAAVLVFKRSQMLALASATTVPILNKSGFSKISIPVPPLGLQRDFARRLSFIDEFAADAATQMKCLNRLFAALEGRLFAERHNDAR